MVWIPGGTFLMGSDRHYPEGEQTRSIDPGDAAAIPRRVMKGGWHLCAPNYCRRYRPDAPGGRHGNLPSRVPLHRPRVTARGAARRHFIHSA